MASKLEIKWMSLIISFGCIACYVQTGIRGTPACVHHITDGGRRKGHLFTIPLCDPGHHKNVQPGSGKEPFHHNKRVFEATYGTQERLLEMMRKILNWRV